jgi:translation initiation factor IF-2
MEQALRGLFREEAREVVEGHAQVRQVFGIPRRGRVAGCQVVDGLLRRGAQVRVLRNGEVLHTGPMSSLRRFKDDVREVTQGFECGLGLEGFNDFQEDDVLESFRLEGGD